MTITLLNNRYQVIQVLGAGGFGETFLAEDTHMPSRRRCVIKQLKPISNDPQTYQLIQQRFEREAATLEYLGKSSDQVPELYAYFSEHGQFYLVQEWIQGQTLRDVIQTQGKLNETSVREILLSLLSVLEYIHSKGIIHRDIKPDNIIIRSADGKPVLIDFGAVKETIRSVVSSPGLPAQSLVIGTPEYMPSEQALGRPVYGTDIYSLGLTAIYLLTGKSPQEIETDQQNGEILWHNYAPNVSPGLVKVLNQAIKPHASDRYTTASKMLYDLESASYIVPPQATSARTQSLSTNQTQPLYSPQYPPQQRQVIPTPVWQKPAVIFSGLAVGGLLIGVLFSNLSRQPAADTPVVTNTTPSPEPSAINTEPTDSPIDDQVSPTASQSPVAEIPAPTSTFAPQANPNVETNPPVTSTLPQQQAPVTTDTPAPVATLAPQPNTQNQPPVVLTPEVRSTPENNTQQPKSVTNNVRQRVPAFPTGTSRSTVEATLGKPARDLRGLWRNTRAVTYKIVPNQIDVGYLFDRNTGALRQTEAAFAQSVDPQVMENTLDGLLGGQANEEIRQGLRQIQQRQSDNFKFSKGGVKGQIVRQNCDFIYISIWDADLHDFVNPADAKQCS
ncbi:protein kinase [Tolypothrix sp. FACHB-123]|uniref:serine/threonine-protein kinase n=1 Tax=Tolypothrix sp. FACHB-123 TaxID=2692868 RepID=UPI0016858D59|nr:serine/threonine-protein kinase [Tolypothrix sp. FACHB-123]MBD2354457.1 protein kinase [Tolypothrix sp. FACHB-123]